MTRGRLASLASLITLLASLGSASVGAQDGGARSPAAGRIERQVVPGGKGPNRLAIDAWVVTHGRPFDLRSTSPRDGSARPECRRRWARRFALLRSRRA